jgi:hypothetical protein
MLRYLPNGAKVHQATTILELLTDWKLKVSHRNDVRCHDLHTEFLKGPQMISVPAILKLYLHSRRVSFLTLKFPRGHTHTD